MLSDKPAQCWIALHAHLWFDFSYLQLTITIQIRVHPIRITVQNQISWLLRSHLISIHTVLYSKTCVKTATLEKTENCFFKTNYHLKQVKVLQNAPRGEFCNTFDLH